jgi:ABC-2 type transport system permease protein
VTFTVARLELKRWFASALGWGLMVASAVLLAWWFLAFVDAFVDAAPELVGRANAPGVTDLVVAPFFASVASALLVLAPLVGMRSFASEHSAQRLPWLLASRARAQHLVFGKWLAVWAVLGAILLLALAMTLSLYAGTTLDLGKLLVGFGGLLLLAGALAALAVLASAQTDHAPTAAAVALGAGVLLWLADAGARARGELDGLINYLALPTHLQPFLRGVFDSTAMAYFVLLTLALLALAVLRVARLRRAAR